MKLSMTITISLICNTSENKNHQRNKWMKKKKTPSHRIWHVTFFNEHIHTYMIFAVYLNKKILLFSINMLAACLFTIIKQIVWYFVFCMIKGSKEHISKQHSFLLWNWMLSLCHIYWFHWKIYSNYFTLSNEFVVAVIVENDDIEVIRTQAFIFNSNYFSFNVINFLFFIIIMFC